MKIKVLCFFVIHAIIILIKSDNKVIIKRDTLDINRTDI